MIGRMVLALVALGSATAARAASDACLTPTELNSTVSFALPSVIDATAQTCRPVLARDGYLAMQGAALSARYRVGQAAAWPVARGAVLKVAGGGVAKLAGLLGDGALQDMAGGVIAQYVVQNVHPGDCPDIEQALALMAPLPPENAAGLIALFVRRADLGDASKPNGAGKKIRLPLCPIMAPPTIGIPDAQPVH